jgi:hypothetical protein
MMVGDDLYRWYPDISKDDIGADTSNKFIDTLQMCNLFCELMGADFDGDQVTEKMVFTEEANDELRNNTKTNAQYITVNGVNGRIVSKEASQAIYNLTLVLPDTKLTDPQF